MNVKFYFVKCRKTNSTMQRPAQEVSFKWSHHRISSAESKVRTSRPFYNLCIEKVKWDIRVLNQNVRFACLSQLEKKALPAFALPIIHLVSRLKFTLALFKLPLWAPQYKKQIGNSNYAQLCRGGGGGAGGGVKQGLFIWAKRKWRTSYGAGKDFPREGTWVNFCWVCPAGLSEPLPHHSIFCGHIINPILVTLGKTKFRNPNLKWTDPFVKLNVV